MPIKSRSKRAYKRQQLIRKGILVLCGLVLVAGSLLALRHYRHLRALAASLNKRERVELENEAKAQPPGSIQIPPAANEEEVQLRKAATLDADGHQDAALALVTSILQTNPRNLDAYTLRGEIYTKMNQWDQAQKDYESMLQLDPGNVLAHFNLTELKFMKKEYDEARVGFVALETNPDWGDLSAYRVFLCDLLGGHEDTAQTEFDAFNQAGSNPSFYFGNSAWYYFHHQPDRGNEWLMKGTGIYAPRKYGPYASSLQELGYLPRASTSP